MAGVTSTVPNIEWIRQPMKNRAWLTTFLVSLVASNWMNETDQRMKEELTCTDTGLGLGLGRSLTRRVYTMAVSFWNMKRTNGDENYLFSSEHIIKLLNQYRFRTLLPTRSRLVLFFYPTIVLKSRYGMRIKLFALVYADDHDRFRWPVAFGWNTHRNRTGSSFKICQYLSIFFRFLFIPFSHWKLI